MKSPLGAQTVLGDRHDLVYEIFCKFRRPPAELARENFPTVGTHIDLRVRRRDHVLREFASRAGVCVGEAQHV